MLIDVTTLVCGTLIGLALGLTGGGGSNFAVPLLVYVLGYSAVQAIPVSLASVALVSAVGAAQAIHKQLISWHPTLTFALGGMLGAPWGLQLAHGLDSRFLLLGFALLAFSVSISMWLRAWRNPEQASAVRALPEGSAASEFCKISTGKKFRYASPCSLALAGAGLVTGVLSGFFGVGGGFLIVPGLMMITRTNIHGAIASSLVVITLTGFAGTVYAMAADQILWSVFWPFSMGGAIGMALGRGFAAKVAGATLQKIFACLICLTACFVLFRLAN